MDFEIDSGGFGSPSWAQMNGRRTSGTFSASSYCEHGRFTATTDCQGGPGCTNTCPTANDGECDDGGPNSMYSVCDLGTDCGDCGARSPTATRP